MRHRFKPLAHPANAALRQEEIAYVERTVGRPLTKQMLPRVEICRQSGAVRVRGVYRTIEVLAQHRPDVLFTTPDRALTAPRRVDDGGGSPGHGRPGCPHGPPTSRHRNGGPR